MKNLVVAVATVIMSLVLTSSTTAQKAQGCIGWNKNNQPVECTIVLSEKGLTFKGEGIPQNFYPFAELGQIPSKDLSYIQNHKTGEWQPAFKACSKRDIIYYSLLKKDNKAAIYVLQKSEPLFHGLSSSLEVTTAIKNNQAVSTYTKMKNSKKQTVTFTADL